MQMQDSVPSSTDYRGWADRVNRTLDRLYSSPRVNEGSMEIPKLIAEIERKWNLVFAFFVLSGLTYAFVTHTIGQKVAGIAFASLGGTGMCWVRFRL